MKDEDMFTSRRRFLRNAGTLSALATIAPLLPVVSEAASINTASLALQPGSAGVTASRQLIGLSYETLQMHDPAFFSGRNEALIGFLRNLNPHGVLRIGGNTSDYAVWSEYRGRLPAYTQVPHAVYRRPYVVTPTQLSHLAEFLHATGWRLIFGLNLRADLPEMAAELAAAVQRAVGDHLLALQIGNEPNNYPDVDGKRIDFDDYFQRWQRTASAVRKRVSVPLAGPDTGANTDWVIAFADRARNIAALTRHDYRGGAPQPTSTIPQLLSGDPGFLRNVGKIERVAARHHLPFILSEVNSYWGGGKLGVSNTFASALWGGDYALACAQRGVAGINFHGGVLSVLEASLGKAPPILPEGSSRFDKLDAISGRYTPIAGDVGKGFYARPLYYGMLLAQQFAGAQFIGNELSANGTNLTAYTARKQNWMLVALFNKDLQRDVSVRIKPGAPARHAHVWRLQAPTLQDVHHTTFAGARVDDRGRWTPGRGETLGDTAGVTLRLPHGSAALIRLDGHEKG